jgi:hypothetical protein
LLQSSGALSGFRSTYVGPHLILTSSGWAGTCPRAAAQGRK